MSLLAYRDYLAHHGIKGQKWGIRRFQNEDGSLTQEGRERYGLNKSTEDVSRYNLKKRVKMLQKESKKYGQDAVNQVLKKGFSSLV